MKDHITLQGHLDCVILDGQAAGPLRYSCPLDALGESASGSLVWGATPPYLEFCSDLGFFDCARSVALWMPPNLGHTETLSVSAKPGWKMTLGPNEENIGLLFRTPLLPQLVPRE